MPQTAKQQLADVLLEGTLDEFVKTRRADGRSWRLIAKDLEAETGVDVTFESIRSWYPEER
jgi:hypothetical protein